MSEAECLSLHQGCADITTGCGGFAGSTCADDEYCAYLPGALCGAGDASAICQPRPNQCDDAQDPVCGCDRQTYTNACFAASAGQGVFSTGACE
jgi:hypothetical protein